MNSITRSNETPDSRGPPAPKKKRNRNPCFACASKKTRCELINPHLCQKCHKDGRNQCLPYVSWPDTIRAATNSANLQQLSPIREGPSDVALNPFESNGGILPQADNHRIQHAYEGPPLQQSFLGANPNLMIPRYHHKGPHLNNFPRMSAGTGQGFYPSAMPPVNPNFNGLINYDVDHVHQHVAPHAPSNIPWMASSTQAGPAAALNSSLYTFAGSYLCTEYATGMNAHAYASSSGLGDVPNTVRFDAA